MKRLKQILVTLCVMCLFINSTVGVYAMEYVEITETDEYYDSTKYPESTDSTHTEFMYTGYTDTTNERRVYSTFEGNSEIVSFVCSGVSGGALGFASLEPFTLTTLKTYPKYPHKGDSGWAQYEDELSTHESFYVEDSGIYVIINTSSNLNTYWYDTGDIYVNTATVLSVPTKVGYTNVKNYLETGDKSCVVKDGLPSYNADELKLDSIDLRFFDSNDYYTAYIEFYYKCPESLVGAELLFNYEYAISLETCLSGNTFCDGNSSTSTYVIESTQGVIKIPIKNIEAINSLVNDDSFFDDLANGLGSVINDRMDPRKIMGGQGFGVGEFRAYKTTKSMLDITIDCSSKGTYGTRYLFNVDFLDGTSVDCSSTPDAHGTYTNNNDINTSSGNYYIETSQDSFGNTVNNYYYIDHSDNSKTEITEYPEYDYDKDTDSDENESGNSSSDSSSSSSITNGGMNNINNNSPTFNNDVDITVEGDEINNEVTNVVDGSVSKEDNDSFVDKFLGLFDMLGNNAFVKVFSILFGWLPSELQGIITTAITISSGIALFKLFRR